ncbi:MAG: HAMP domain-containing sensor histidine kinase [bacterium]
MHAWWRRTNFLIKHQLYLRILPVVVASVLAVGLFSGRLLSSRAVHTYLEQQSEEQTTILNDLRHHISIKVLALEARKDERLAAFDATDIVAGLPRETRLLDEFGALDQVCGASLIDLDPAVAGQPLDLHFEPGLDSPANRNTVQQWATAAKQSLAGYDWVELLAQFTWSGGPCRAVIDDFHTVWIFPPLVLTGAAQTDAANFETLAGPTTLAVLPVMVVEEACWNYPLTLVDRPTFQRPQLMVLLDIAAVARETGLAAGVDAGVNMLLAGNGQLVAANVDSLEPGLNLTAASGEVFRGVPGSELAALFSSASDGIAHAYLGSRVNPYVFTLSTLPELPLCLVSALPFAKIHGGMVLYTAIVVVMAIIGLLGSILAIMRVGERLSDRLQTMSINMGEVASGDYTRRMAVGSEDEVGRLVSYFNLMTVGLDEAHEELREKTRRLRIALERMKRLDKAKDDFLALISHEVRTPLTSIMGGIDFLQMVVPLATPEQQKVVDQLKLNEIIEIIEGSGIRLRDFMNDAILMTSLQSSDTKLRVTPMLFNDLCEMVLSGLQQDVAAKEVTVSVALPRDGAWLALCDRELMETAVEKLLRNAIQHNVGNGVVRIEEVTSIPGQGDIATLIGEKGRHELAEHPAFAQYREAGVQWRIISIFNTGPAIPAEKREALFKKFEIVGRIEHHQKSSGLSLSIVKGVVENHLGRVLVNSHENEGNYFYLLLPGLSDELALKKPTGSGEEQWQGLIGAARDEQIHVSGDAAALDVELEHVGA